jgi:hypothetical protein
MLKLISFLGLLNMDDHYIISHGTSKEEREVILSIVRGRLFVKYANESLKK